jgi:ABC-type glycerol-3-phosphate transport system substrate-binding protein
MTAITLGDVPDVVVTGSMAAAYTLASQGAFEALDSALGTLKFDFTNITPSVIPLMKYKNVSYIIPQNTDVDVLFYRTDFFEEAGLDITKPPRTIQELDEYALKLEKTQGNEVTRYGFIPWLDVGGLAYLWYRPFGVDPFDEDTGKVTLVNEQTVKIYEWQRRYAQKYNPERLRAFTSSLGSPFSPDHAFMTGKVAMTVTRNSFINAIRIYAPDTKYDIAPIPAIDLNHYGGSTLGGNIFFVPRGAKNVLGGTAFAIAAQETKFLEDNNRDWYSLGIFKDRFADYSLYKENDIKLMKIIDITYNKNSGQWVLSSITSRLDDILNTFRDVAIYTNDDIMAGLLDIETRLQSEADRFNR